MTAIKDLNGLTNNGLDIGQRLTLGYLRTYPGILRNDTEAMPASK